MPLPALDVSPNVLQWARKESGLSLEDAADKLGLDVGDIYRWEEDGKQIPLTTLESLAGCYRRQLAVFFLPKPPEPTKRPRDKRNFKPSDAVEFGPESMLAIRRTSRYLELARNLEDHSRQYAWIELFKNGVVTMSTIWFQSYGNFWRTTHPQGKS